MKTIFSKNELKKIYPSDLIAYLKAKGWIQKQNSYDSLLIWTQNKKEKGEFEVLVPLEINFIDYTLRISETLNVLEVFENRSADLIYQNLVNSSSDILRIRTESSKTLNGTLPLNDSCDLLGASRDLITAVACSTILPKANYPSRKPDKVVEFMEKVQFDHTEKGSFIITISTKIPPILKVSEVYGEDKIDEPFERKVMMNLLYALEACKEASKKALVTNDIVSFEKVVEKGVSANLCKAIVDISNSCGDGCLDISMDWSLSRPVSDSIPNKIEFSKDLLPIISEAARTFKETKPIEEFEVKGVVLKLSKDNNCQKNGEITVFGLIEGQQRKINIKLEESAYSLAIKAHRDGIAISCLGELKKSGNIYSLINPRGFALTENL